jgi:hypothetical protein
MGRSNGANTSDLSVGEVEHDLCEVLDEVLPYDRRPVEDVAHWQVLGGLEDCPGRA